MPSPNMQSHIEEQLVTNDQYIRAQSTEWTYMNQPLLQPYLEGLGRIGRAIHVF
jgi:hypothetical protein